MRLQRIKSKKQYEAYLDWVDEMFEKKVKPDSPEGEKLQIVLILIKDYEDKHYPIPKPDPIEAIKSKMEEQGLKQKDLVGIVGGKSYVSALLNKKKPLTLEIARIFHKKFGVPAEILLS